MIAVVAAVVVAAVFVGVGAERRLGERAERAARRTLSVMLYVLVPFVVFFNVARLEFTFDVGVGIGLAYAALAVCGLTAWMAAARGLRLGRPATGAVVCATIQANTGYLGLPLAAALFDEAGFAQAVAYDSLVQSPTLIVAGFAVGAAFGVRAGEGARGRTAAFLTRNPPLVAVALALVAPASLAPDVLVDASRVVVFALLPLGFFAVGAILSAEAEEGVFSFPPALTPPVATVLGLRLLAAPALLALFALPLIDLPDPYLLLAAMPVGINTLVVAHAFGLDLRLSAEAVAWSTALVLLAALGAAFGAALG